METKNAHILITGANRGIGRAFAERMAEDKAHLILPLRTEDPELKKILLEKGAASVEISKLDLSDRLNIERFIEENKARDIDILFNNAGMLTGGLIEEQKIEEIYQLLQVNISALIHMTHGFLPQMLKRKKGKVINHASVSGYLYFPCASVYAASKAAVIAFTQSVELELKNTGVSTLCLVTPGVETRMYRDISNKYSKNLDVGFLKGMPVKEYADRIRYAIHEDVEFLKPTGFQGIGLLANKYARPLFNRYVMGKFKR